VREQKVSEKEMVVQTSRNRYELGEQSQEAGSRGQMTELCAPYRIVEQLWRREGRGCAAAAATAAAVRRKDDCSSAASPGEVVTAGPSQAWIAS
jgi:hypothetical protein